MVRPHRSFGTLFDCKSLNLKVCCSAAVCRCGLGDGILWPENQKSDPCEPRYELKFDPETKSMEASRPTRWLHVLAIVSLCKTGATKGNAVPKSDDEKNWRKVSMVWWSFSFGVWSWKVCRGMVWICHTKGMQKNCQMSLLWRQPSTGPCHQLRCSCFGAHLEWTIVAIIDLSFQVLLLGDGAGSEWDFEWPGVLKAFLCHWKDLKLQMIRGQEESFPSSSRPQNLILTFEEDHDNHTNGSSTL